MASFGLPQEGWVVRPEGLMNGGGAERLTESRE